MKVCLTWNDAMFGCGSCTGGPTQLGQTRTSNATNGVNLQYWFALPQLLACVLHFDKDQREQGLKHARAIIAALQKAEAVAAPSAILKDLLQDLAWQKQQLPREIMALILQNKNSELRALAERLYTGSPSTKDILENAFAFLHRKAAGHMNSKMADATKYTYTVMNPYAETGGCPQVLPQVDDYITLLGPTGHNARMWAHRNLFSPQRTLFPSPTAVHQPADIFASKFRTAGPLSQQRSFI